MASLTSLAAAQAQFVEQAVVGDFGGVGDEGKNRVVQVVVDRAQDRVGQARAEGLALAVDVGVVAARKVDALEGAAVAVLGRLGKGRVDHLAAAFDHQRVAGGNFAHGVIFGAENRLERDAFAGDGDDFVVLEIVARADAVRVAHDKAVAVADEARDGVAAVPLLGGGAEDFDGVELGGNAVGDFRAGHALVAQLAEDAGVLLVEVVADFLEHGLRVGVKNGVDAALDELLVEFVGVGEVEIAADHQVAGLPTAFAEIGVAGALVVAAGGAVAQVPEQDLAAELEVFLHRVGEFGEDAALADEFVVGLELLGENVGQRVGARVALAEHEGPARRHVELDAADARAVLAAVVLLLHQQEKLVEAVERRLVFLRVIAERLAAGG